jgi:hypothetical protein
MTTSPPQVVRDKPSVDVMRAAGDAVEAGHVSVLTAEARPRLILGGCHVDRLV